MAWTCKWKKQRARSLRRLWILCCVLAGALLLLHTGSNVERRLRAHSLFVRGKACAECGDHNSAIRYYTSALQVEPTYYQACYLRGMSHLAKGDLGRAVSDWEQCLELMNGAWFALAEVGMAYLRAKAPEKAVFYLKRASAANGLNVRVRYLLAVAYYDNGDYESAIRECDRAIRLNPVLARAYFRKGMALERLGETASALDAYEGCLSRVTDGEPALAEEARKGIRRNQRALQSNE